MAMREIESPKNTKRVCDETGSEYLELTDDFKRFQEIRQMSFGCIRRNELMKLLSTGFSFAVNIKHCIIVEHDPDIQRLLKKNKIELYTVKASKKTKHTYVRIKNNEK